jgi:mannobiose 2-epimerase
MFQHHLCQAYEQLYRATGDPEVGKAVREFAEYMVDTLFDPEYDCFKGFMDMDGNRIGTRQSFGHDCEISYLALDMAELTGDEDLISRTKEVCTKVLRKVLENDFDSYGSLINGGDLLTGENEKSHVWWAQAEAVTAMLCGYQITGDDAFLDACIRQLDYIETYFVDRVNGDWHNNIVVDETGCHIVDGSHGFDKLNSGKCPFHNSHMCFEVIKRVGLLLSKQQ